MKFEGIIFLMDRKKKIHLSCRVEAGIPRFHPQLIYHIFHMNYPSEVVTLCCDLVHLPVNFKNFLS